VPQLSLHAQVSMHFPSMHMLPGPQLTAAQGSGAHRPPLQLCPAGQVIPAHGFGELHARWHALSVPQSI
jgi:hypothetical protein